MKTNLLPIITSLVIAATVASGEKPVEVYRSGYSWVFLIVVEGHKYLLFDGLDKGGITHAASCTNHAPTIVTNPCQRVHCDTPTPREYKDADGKPISLMALVVHEPEWATSQILHRDKLERELAEAIEQNRNLLLGSTWVCVHCGYFAKSKDGQNELKAHIAECPNHPMAALKAELAEARTCLQALCASPVVNGMTARIRDDAKKRGDRIVYDIAQNIIAKKALASRGRENEQANPTADRRATAQEGTHE